MKNLSSNSGLSKLAKKESFSSRKVKLLSSDKITRDSGKVRLGDGVAPPVFAKR
jgi:hypothetical protein